ncbi:class I SAM-dependent methyltransferase [Novispirillum itersonii]|uniref:Ubiquinone/menaquinone biosynthesis C-methylase UbiE n=1 Tax=Novispirillum itersonii TaxID=189 RepID=A0A7W9ZCM0_NOVIT|nr:methyltransferase domain-containing protein [Novispirillum itersonii]MBB6209021.1 ubiquinone/menaquinone biosynthesis C-methylase UbiE [Novispirillum itersonii]
MSLRDRFIDVTARKPSGWIGRSLYRESRPHRQGFDRLKTELALRPGETVVETGCGAGVLLQEMLAVCAAGAAIDHSPEMIALSAERNHAAIAAGRLDLRLGDVHALPWADASFDAAASAHMFFFVADPGRMLAEVRRVLKPGGRLVIVTAARSASLFLRPYAPAMRYYSDADLSGLVTAAGFVAVRVWTEGRHLQLAHATAPL